MYEIKINANIKEEGERFCRLYFEKKKVSPVVVQKGDGLIIISEIFIRGNIRAFLFTLTFQKKTVK